MSKPTIKTFILQDDDEKIWNNVLDNFEDGAHENQSSSVGDDNENGDLIGVVHNQAHNLSTDLLLKLGLFKPNSIPPTFNLSITMPQGMKEMVALPNFVMDV